MSSYDKTTKSADSYELLAKLLNSGGEDSADRVYNALLAISEDKYNNSVKKTTAEYAAGRDVLSSNRAKADRYLSYFLSQGGYEGSGTAADARVKQAINYDGQVNELNEKERQAKADLLTEKNEEQLELAEKAYDASNERAELELKEKQLDAENYWRGKQLEQEKELASSPSSSSSGGGDNTGAYRVALYNELYEKFDMLTTYEEMREVYDSLTGANVTESKDIYGEQLYAKLITDIREKMTDKLKQDRYDKHVSEIFSKFSSSPTHPNEVYFDIYRDIMYTRNYRYTKEELDDAYSKFTTYD